MRSTMAESVIRKIFVIGHNQKLDTILPRLTTSSAVNTELYALIGLILRQFVHSWYSRITDDRQITLEISRCSALIAGAVECRISKLDFESLILDDIPYVVDRHLQGISSYSVLNSSDADLRLAKEHRLAGLLPSSEPLADSFHRLRPHPALNSPEDEKAFCKLLSKGMMALILDDANVRSTPSRALLSAILCDIALKNAVNKLAEPWMIYEIIAKLTDVVNKAQRGSEKNRNVLFSLTGAISSLIVSVPRLISVSSSEEKTKPHISESSSLEVPTIFDRQIVRLVTDLFYLHDRNPLAMSMIYLVNVISSGFFNNRLSKWTSMSIGRFSCNETASMVLKAFREALFPGDGFMGPPREEPSEEEKRLIRERAKGAILSLTGSASTRAVVFGGSPSEAVETLLDTFADKQVNKHLIFTLLDLLITNLLPELTESTPQEILSAKLNRSCP